MICHMLNGPWLQLALQHKNFHLVFEQDRHFDGTAAKFFVFERV